MEIVEGIEIVDLGLFLKKERVLIISDTQIGYEESLNRKGMMIPRFQFSDMMERLDEMVERCGPKKLIINGDIKHEFGDIIRTEWKNVLEMIEHFEKKAKIILIKGNHDTMLEPIARRKDIALKDHFKLDGIYICHGHKIPTDVDFKKSKVIIIGHEHPALGLREKGRAEKFKCFLKGSYKDKALIVMPSFNPVTEGTDILSERLLSPFLKDIGNFEAIVCGKEPLSFGTIRNLAL
jgi:uncharacterized protein